MEVKTVPSPLPGSLDLGHPMTIGESLPWPHENGQPFRVLAEDGSVEDSPAVHLPDETLGAIYREMLFLRALDTRAISMHRQGRIGFHVPSRGEEALQIGSAFALEPDDWVYSAYRELGVALHRGYPLEELLCQFFGNSGDILKGRQMPDHFGSAAIRFTVASSPVGTQIPHAAGAAFAARLGGQGRCVITYFGDGATSTGDFHAGMNLAGLHRLPIVFFCKNNGWAISLPRERQTAAPTLAQKAHGYGFEGVRVDGNDALAVHHVTLAAVDRARRGDGPTMIEAVTYRMGPHSTADDASRYRSDEEVEAWKARDPLDRYRAFLTQRGLWSEEQETTTTAEVEERITAAIAAVEKLPPPAPATMFDDVYAELPWHLREERDEVCGSGE